MQPPVAGRTGRAPPPPVGPPGAGGGAGAALDIAFVAVVSGVGALAPAPTTVAPHPIITMNTPALTRSATDLPTFLITSTVGAGRLMRRTEARRLAELDAAGRASQYRDSYWALGGMGNGALGDVSNLVDKL